MTYLLLFITVIYCRKIYVIVTQLTLAITNSLWSGFIPTSYIALRGGFYGLNSIIRFVRRKKKAIQIK